MKWSLPAECEPILATMSELFAAEGLAREVAILTFAQAQLIQVDYDNWNGGTFILALNLQIPPMLYHQIRDDIEECKRNIHGKVQAITVQFDDGYVRDVNIAPILKSDPEWRDKNRAWLVGDGVTNQGRVRSDNVAPRTYEGLQFRSEPEILFFRALKSLGVPFAPLPVFIKGGADYRRIEPDFIILQDGIVMMVEIDGDTVHHETPAEAQARSNMLAHEGAHVERIPSSRCCTPELAMASAKRMLAVAAKYKMNR